MNYKMVNPEIKFINHASILISYKKINLLSDPWYAGTAFDNGWKLLYESNVKEIHQMLENKVTHIWISHEHPDHFSVSFFKIFKNILINKKIQILFQETNDKRVISFLKKNNYIIRELKFMKDYFLTKDFSIKCIKDGFYDSALLATCGSKKILNLNDCQFNDEKSLLEIKKLTGKLDLLATQFSYAAWKGGIKNISWRQKAAEDKITNIKMQIKYLKPNFLLPFASFIYFCNKDNFYMNDSINKPKDLINKLKGEKSNILIMQPNEIFDFNSSINNKSAIQFWNIKLEQIKDNELCKSNIIGFDKLLENFQRYRARIITNNNLLLLKFIYYFLPLSFFRPVYIFLEDLKETFEIDYVKNIFKKTSKKPMLIMKSESLLFIFQNKFGFDTINVNSRFEEANKYGWSKASKSLAIETLNNMGYKVNINLFFNRNIILLFFKVIFKVNKNLK